MFQLDKRLCPRRTRVCYQMNTRVCLCFPRAHKCVRSHVQYTCVCCTCAHVCVFTHLRLPRVHICVFTCTHMCIPMDTCLCSNRGAWKTRIPSLSVAPCEINMAKLPRCFCETLSTSKGEPKGKVLILVGPPILTQLDNPRAVNPSGGSHFERGRHFFGREHPPIDTQRTPKTASPALICSSSTGT